MIKKYEALIFFFVLILVSSSIYFGYNHSIYNQDYHHSFFILSMLIDYEDGLKLYEDIILQYGLGQLYFFNFIGNFINLNLVSISLITSIIYSLNLLFLFKIFKKVSTDQIAFILIIIIYLIHPYSIYPWPDYLSGLCLTIFFYFLLNDNSKTKFFLCSLFLFLAIFFRSTYIINIFFSIFIYSLLLFVINKKNNLKYVFNLFWILIFLFFFLLFYFNSLQSWFDQSIWQITNYARETGQTEIYNKISKYFGDYGFIILKIFYYFFNSIIKLLNITNLKNIVFIFFIIINIYFIILLYKKRTKISEYEKIILFISILGLSGFVQSLMLMEVFRNINATMGIFITGLYLIKNNEHKLFLKKNSKVTIFSISLYIILLLINFPFQKYEKNNYVTFNNKYFSNKKMTKPVKDYYTNLSKFICHQKNTSFLNLTNDYAIAYICENKNIHFEKNLSPFMAKYFKKNEYKRILIEQKLEKNELLFFDKKLINPKNLELIKIFETPHNPKEWYGDIYVYKKF